LQDLAGRIKFFQTGESIAKLKSSFEDLAPDIEDLVQPMKFVGVTITLIRFYFQLALEKIDEKNLFLLPKIQIKSLQRERQIKNPR